MSYLPPSSDAAHFEWQGEQAYTPPADGQAHFSWSDSTTARVRLDSPMGGIAALATAPSSARASLSSPLDDVTVSAIATFMERINVVASIGSPLDLSDLSATAQLLLSVPTFFERRLDRNVIMLKTSTGLRNAMLVTGPFRTVMAGGQVNIYSGTPPATADAALTGTTLLCTVTATGGIQFNPTPTAPGVIDSDSATQIQGTNAASGTATFFRHVLPGDTGALSDTQMRLQGDIGLVGMDMNMSSTSLVAGAVTTMDRLRYALPTF